MVDLAVADVIQLGVGGIFLWVYVQERNYNKSLIEKMFVMNETIGRIINENTKALQAFTDKLEEFIKITK